MASLIVAARSLDRSSDESLGVVAGSLNQAGETLGELCETVRGLDESLVGAGETVGALEETLSGVQKDVRLSSLFGFVVIVVIRLERS